MATILLGMGLLPFVAALFETEQIPQPRQLADQKDVPAIAFRQYAVNLREVPARGLLSIPFHFWNRGSTAVDIQRLDPSCGCLTPRLVEERSHFEPGAQGAFEVQVEPAKERPGQHIYTIDVHYNDGVPRVEQLVFKLAIPERKVSVMPSELFIYQMSGQSEETELVVTDERGKALEILSAKTSSPDLTLAVGPAERKEAGTTRIPVQVKARAGLPAAPSTAVITLRLNDEEVPEITVPVFMHGRPGPVQLTSGIVPQMEGSSASPTSSRHRHQKSYEKNQVEDP